MKVVPNLITLAAFTASALLSFNALAQKKSRDEMVIEDRDNLKKNDLWIYNDLQKAKDEAKSASKPLMVVFRCIP